MEEIDKAEQAFRGEASPTPHIIAALRLLAEAHKIQAEFATTTLRFLNNAVETNQLAS